MSRRTRFDAAAAVVLAVALGAACTGGSGNSDAQSTTTPPTVAPTPTRTVTMQPALLAGADAKAAVAPVEVSIRPARDGELAVTFDETAVGSTAKQWEAAAWNAAIVASLVTGAPLAGRELHFKVNGRLAGLGAGAPLTIAVIALLRGDQLEPDITATGTMNPDGTIAPVTGVPESVAAAVRAHRARMVVPVGQARAVDASGKTVDVVAAGARLGLRVVEAGDVYDAYPLFTGKALPQPPASTKTTLNRDVYARLARKVDTWNSRFAAARDDFRSLAPSVQQDLNPYAAAAQRQQQQARKLADAGQEAGAFSAMMNAAALMRAVARTGVALPTLLTQGVPPFVTALKTGTPIEREMHDQVAALDKVDAEHLSDVSALLASYGNVIDAASLVRFSQQLFAAKDAAGQPDLSRVVEGAVYYGLAGALVGAARDLVAVADGLGGTSVLSNADPAAAADALRQAAKANLAAFQSTVVAPRALATGAGIAASSDAIAQADTVFALARTGDQTLAALPEVLGDSTPSAYAALGGAISLYARSAALGAKYSTLGVVDPDSLQLVRAANPGALASALDRGQARLAASLALLRAYKVNPTIVAADYEIGTADRDRAVNDKFDALGDFWDGYVNSRVLAQLGGLATAR